jgi:four helix bundle protein
MPGNDSWHDLQVWQKAHAACLAVYRLTTAFPAEERYGLGSQLRRSSSSIPANIAEGKGRATNADFRHFLIIARGSLEETRYHLLLTHDLGYLNSAAYESTEAAYTEISRMLNALIRSLS